MNYQILVRGRLGRMMRAAFASLHADAQGQDTLLTGALPDQAALHGVLARIEALGLELLEVRRLPGRAPGARPALRRHRPLRVRDHVREDQGHPC